MSDGFLALVPKQEHFENPQAIAEKIVNWLIAERIIKPIKTDCVLGDELGYSPDQNSMQMIKQELKEHYECVTKGLEIKIGRAYYQGYECFEPILIACPGCHSNLLEGMELMDYYQDTLAEKYQAVFTQVDNAIDEWYNGKKGLMQCPLCGGENGITNYSFETPRGFSNPAFIFWNWSHDFTETFIEEFEQKLECSVTVIPGLI